MVIPVQSVISFHLGDVNIEPASVLRRFGNPVYNEHQHSTNAVHTPSTDWPYVSKNVVAENFVAVSMTWSSASPSIHCKSIDMSSPKTSLSGGMLALKLIGFGPNLWQVSHTALICFNTSSVSFSRSSGFAFFRRACNHFAAGWWNPRCNLPRSDFVNSTVSSVCQGR